MVRPIVSPTVPAGTERVRVCLHAGNTIDEVDRLVARVQIWLRRHVELGTEPRKEQLEVRSRM